MTNQLEGLSQRGTPADAHYGFSLFGLGRIETTTLRTLSTSLVVDSPHGRIPPITTDAEGQPIGQEPHNYSLTNALTAARAEEKRAAEEAGKAERK